jgi:hypothetical protein
MSKSISVFTADSNPAIDLPKYHASRYQAQDMVTRLRSHVWISPTAIHEIVVDARSLVAGSSFLQAWHRKPSAGIVVWQMRPNKLVADRG